MSDKQQIGIIGAGVAGLTAAYALARRGLQVTLFESSDRVGGLAAGFRASHWDWPLEQFYHHLFVSDDAILDLAKEVGSQVFFRRPVTSVWFEGMAYPFDTPLRVLTFPHLSLVDKLRMGLVIAYLRYLNRNWLGLERTTADAWLRRWMGKRSYQTLWEPLLQGKFGEHYPEVNLAWFWARIAKRSPSLGYFVGGFQAFADRLAEAIQQQGGTIHTGVQVQALQYQDGCWQVEVDRPGLPCNGFDALIATVPPYVLARMVRDLPGSYLAGLRRLKSMGAIVMTLALDRPITDGHYWINLPKAAGFPFLAFVEHTNYIEPEHYGGDHLVYCGDYLERDHRYFALDDDELLEAFLPGLQRIRPDFDRRWIKEVWVHKAGYAQPVPPIGYSQQIPDLRTPLPGLYFASMSQVYPWDRGTNYAVEIGQQVATLVAEDLGYKSLSEKCSKPCPRGEQAPGDGG